MSITFVKPEGNPETATIALVGEQPGKSEIKEGRPFSGQAGKMLDDCLRSVGILRSECYITNVFKDLDKPLSSYMVFGKEHKITPEGRHQVESLFYELRQIKAKVIIGLGWVPLFALSSRQGISKWRGSILELDAFPSKVFIPTFHPATALPAYYGGKDSQEKGGQYENKLLIQYDLQKGKKIIDQGEFKRTQRNLIIDPAFSSVLDYLAEMKNLGLNGTIIDFDIELKNEEVSCISICSTFSKIMSIPFIDSHGHKFTVDQEAFIWKLIADLLENPNIRKRGQYIIFDSHFLLRKYGICAVNLDDTMIAQKILMPDYPVGLDFITSIWTDKEYYKDEGKRYFDGGNWPRLWQYNATDSAICNEAFPKQLEALKAQGNLETYERQRKMIEPLVYMMERGIKIDVEGMKKAYDKAEKEIEKLKEELNTLAGCELNSNSPKQLIEYFYGKKKIPPYKEKGKITTDEKALVRIARKGFVEASKILEIRRLVKKRSTYLNVEKVDTDGRLRSAYNPVGTRYSRISSSKSIFGTGNNLQNQPHDVLQFFLADDGYIYYGIDLSQAENRIVAYVGQVPQMIEAFEKGLDVHSLTGSLIFGFSPEEIKRQDNENIPCHLGDGTKPYRFFGKKANHGLNYDLRYKNFALQLEIPEADAKFIVNRYHLAYPGVRQNYHAMVKKQLSINGTLTNLMGRRTVFLSEWGDTLFKEAYSCIPQGTVGDVINERGVELLYYDQENFSPVELLTQVHDSIGFQIPISSGFQNHAKILTLLKNSLETPLTLPHGGTFSIPADISIGLSMYDRECKKISAKKFPSSLDDLAKKLELIYNDLERERNERSIA